MGEPAGVASAAGNAGSAASTAGSVAGNAGAAMNAFEAGSGAMSTGGYLDSALSAANGGAGGATGAGGFGLEATALPEYGPTNAYATSVPMSSGQSADLARWGTSDPSWWQQGYDYYDRLSKGMNNDLPTAYKQFGNNPETYGYGMSKLSEISKMFGSGVGPKPSAAPITNVTYQNKDDEYRRRYGRRY